ncbi:hypothetical protein BC833DRAFT_593420 [Globomyces pollinis-pini]|nr:hypothetical protein BC833DRAFT_593420 [Globomyces pollinis-pini]
MNPSEEYAPQVSTKVVDTNHDQPVCRICLCNDDPNEPFISPCSCNGTMKYIHLSCLNKWLLTKGPIYQCEVCQFEYDVHQRIRTATVLKSTWLTFIIFCLLTASIIALCGLLTPLVMPVYKSIKIDNVSYWILYIVTGFFVYGIIGFLVAVINTTISCCTSTKEEKEALEQEKKRGYPSRPVSYFGGYHSNNFYCWYFACSGWNTNSDCNCSGGDGNGCMIICGLCGAVFAVLGILYIFIVGYVILYRAIQDFLTAKGWKALNEKER